MSVKSSVANVGVNATLIASGSGTGGSSILLKAVGAMFVGGNDVTAANGFPVAAGATFSLDLGQNESLYGVAAAATTANLLVQGA
jgi:hypothetical protein